MKKLLILLAVILAAMLTVVSAAETILPAYDINMENELSDCVLSVGFELTDVTETDITVCVYSGLNYDIMDVASLDVGSTLVTDKGEITVKTIERYDDVVYINFDMDDSAALFSPEDTNGYVLMAEEYPAMILLGQAQLQLADNVTLTVSDIYADDGDTGYTQTVAAADLGSALYTAAADIYCGFDPVCTSVVVEGGLVTEIHIN